MIIRNTVLVAAALFVAACSPTDTPQSSATTSTSTTVADVEAAGAASAGGDSAGVGAPGVGSTGAGDAPPSGEAGGGSPAADGAPARTMRLFIEADVRWSDSNGCTVTDTTMHVRIDLNFYDNGLVDGVSDESSMGHTPVTRCGSNQMGDWTTIEAPVVNVLPSYWDRDGIHLRLDWSDVTEIAVSTGPIQQAATEAVARDSLCTDWPGNLFLFLIPSDWPPTQAARCEYGRDANSGEIFLAITEIDGDETWRSIPEFLDHLTFPTDDEYAAILEARAVAEEELGGRSPQE